MVYMLRWWRKFKINQVVIIAWWEWPPATITQVIAVKNRSHNPKTTEIKFQVCPMPSSFR